MESKRRTAAVMTCMDYRLHEASAAQYSQLCEILNVDRCYIETEAGPDGAILNGGDRWKGAMRNLSIIDEAKHPDIFAIVAHYDCAGYPVSNEQHDHDVVAAAKKLSLELFGENGKVVPLVAYPSEGEGPTWRIKRLDSETRKSAIAA